VFRLACTKGVLSQHRVSARALLVARAFLQCFGFWYGRCEGSAVLVSGSAQRRVLRKRPTPVHRQWVASVGEETAAVVIVVDGCEQRAGGSRECGMRREKTSLVRERRRAVQRLRPGDAMRVAVKRIDEWMDCDFCRCAVCVCVCCGVGCVCCRIESLLSLGLLLRLPQCVCWWTKQGHCSVWTKKVGDGARPFGHRPVWGQKGRGCE
jgi:hypothetical protein